MLILDLLYIFIMAAIAYVFIGVPVLKFIGALFVITMVIYSIAILKSPKKEPEDDAVIHIKATLTESDEDPDDWHLDDRIIHASPNPVYKASARRDYHSEYAPLHNDSPFEDNMNYQRYVCHAVFKETGRKRKRILEGFSPSDVRYQLIEQGYEAPFEIEQIPFAPPTPNQISSCREYGTYIPGDACSEDVHYIINRVSHHDSIPNPELMTYATEMHIKLSYYIGKRRAYTIIFDTLKNEDKTAFFIFCVYRFLSDDRRGNLNQSPYKNIFYDFAKAKQSDKSFLRSMNRYRGSDLRFFGELRANGTIHTGGSKNTIAYKEARKFLFEASLIPH